MLEYVVDHLLISSFLSRSNDPIRIEARKRYIIIIIIIIIVENDDLLDQYIYKSLYLSGLTILVLTTLKIN
jgi:hypothetical protein